MFSFRGKNKYGSKKGENTDVVKNEIFNNVKTVDLPKVEGTKGIKLELYFTSRFQLPFT